MASVGQNIYIYICIYLHIMVLYTQLPSYLYIQLKPTVTVQPCSNISIGLAEFGSTCGKIFENHQIKCIQKHRFSMDQLQFKMLQITIFLRSPNMRLSNNSICTCVNDIQQLYVSLFTTHVDNEITPHQVYIENLMNHVGHDMWLLASQLAIKQVGFYIISLNLLLRCGR